MQKELNKDKNKDHLLNILKEVMGEDEDILFAYLYGSLVFNSIHLESDIDIAVYLKPSDIREYIGKEERILSVLIDNLHTHRIDLRILNGAPFLLKYHVLKDGIPIVIKGESARVDFEDQVMNRFFELKPYLDEYKQMLFTRIKAGL